MSWAEENSLWKSHEAGQSRSLKEPENNMGDRNPEREAGEIRRGQSMKDLVDQRRDFSLALRAMRRPLVNSKQSMRQGQISFHSYPNSLFIHSFNKCLLSKHTKRCSASLVILGMRLKPQQHTITYPQERQK